MKKSIVFIFLAVFTFSYTAQSQSKKTKAEVLYFKADLACCKAKSCNNLEGTVKKIIEKNYTDGSVTFKQVRISDSTNNDLVKKYNAKSQTIILEVSKKKKKSNLDLTETVKSYILSNDFEKLEKELTAKINEKLK